MRKIITYLQDEINAAVLMLNVDGKKMKGFVTNTRCGRTYPLQRIFSVPLWAYKKGTDYFLYYTAHEISHFYASKRGHGRSFYLWFKRICPQEFQHYELEYKKRNAAHAGISKKED